MTLLHDVLALPQSHHLACAAFCCCAALRCSRPAPKPCATRSSRTRRNDGLPSRPWLCSWQCRICRCSTWICCGCSCSGTWVSWARGWLPWTCRQRPWLRCWCPWLCCCKAGPSAAPALPCPVPRQQGGHCRARPGHAAPALVAHGPFGSGAGQAGWELEAAAMLWREPDGGWGRLAACACWLSWLGLQPLWCGLLRHI